MSDATSAPELLFFFCFFFFFSVLLSCSVIAASSKAMVLRRSARFFLLAKPFWSSTVTMLGTARCFAPRRSVKPFSSAAAAALASSRAARSISFSASMRRRFFRVSRCAFFGPVSPSAIRTSSLADFSFLLLSLSPSAAALESFFSSRFCRSDWNQVFCGLAAISSLCATRFWTLLASISAIRILRSVSSSRRILFTSSFTSLTFRR
mmetsp:Transcript_8855/g.33437  ORF Transcript_8855/g.33437 Transcript_8855/m.33437 type:complete len:207 (+) Transcript_8855:241-861(+)